MNKKRLASALLLVLSVTLIVLPGSGCINLTSTTTPVTGDVLNLYGTDPYTLDPAVAGDGTSNYYILQIFSGLVRLDENTLEPVPDIASGWDISDNGTVYTFRLREDAYFHDGRQVKASDFKYSWERACAPETGSQTAPAYLGDIVGVDAVLNGESKAISGVEVLGDFTLRVTIKQPESYFLYKLSYSTAFVVDRNEASAGLDWWRQPNGTGAFKLYEWQQGSSFILQKNEKYYGQKAKLDFVVFKLLAGIPMDLYETGEIDVAEIGLGYIDRATDPDGDLYGQLSIVPQLSMFYIGFDCSRPPFDDPAIRRAFAMALDKDKLVSLVFQNTVTRADGILPLGMPGYNEDLTAIPFDPEGAKALIAASEYGSVSNLPPITITVGGEGNVITSDLEAIINEWRINLGVEVSVRQLESEQFLYHAMEEKDEMFYWGWGADYPHPQDFLEILFATGSSSNTGEYSNPQADALLQAAATESDQEASFELYRQAEQIMIDDAACIPLWYSQSYLLVKPYVKGYHQNALGVAMLNEVYLEH